MAAFWEAMSCFYMITGYIKKSISEASTSTLQITIVVD